MAGAQLRFPQTRAHRGILRCKLDRGRKSIQGFRGFPDLRVTSAEEVECLGIRLAIAKLFTEQRGLATGIANSGATAGQFITVPLVTAGLAYVSWQWSIAALALICVVMAAVIWFYSPENACKELNEIAV